MYNRRLMITFKKIPLLKKGFFNLPRSIQEEKHYRIQRWVLDEQY